MLPTRHGIIFSIVLLAMLLVAVNYNNSLAYIMTFTLASTVLVSMLYTHRNLAGLCIYCGQCDEVFAGKTLNYTLILTNKTKRDRFDIGIDIKGDESRRRDFSAHETLSIECRTRVLSRGWHSLPGVQVNTRFPLGLLFSWSRSVDLEKKALVYPTPSAWHEFPTRYSDRNPRPVLRKKSHDEYSGLRAFRDGDSPRHIDWKAYARGKGLYSKEFLGGESPELSFHWEDTQGEKEERISLLTRWVIDATAQEIRFSLEIPGNKIPASIDKQHSSICLKALALL